MDGAHDMGGMHGFGSVAAIVEPDEPTFHERWEGRTFALMLSTGGLRAGGVRPNIEAMPPADYLRATYFERWAFSVERGLVLADTLTTADIDERVAHPADVPATANPGRTAGLVARVDHATQPACRGRRRALRGRAAGDRAPDGARAPPPVPSLRARRHRDR